MQNDTQEEMWRQFPDIRIIGERKSLKKSQPDIEPELDSWEATTLLKVTILET